jgi:ring-1,2-phenylacetyl-CoA epoxidase subunit PaaA
MSTAVPFCESIGIDVPAHHDAAAGRYVIDFPFPAQFDEREKRWLLEEGAISWDDVQERWRRRGPANEEFVEMIQRGRLQRRLAAA